MTSTVQIAPSTSGSLAGAVHRIITGHGGERLVGSGVRRADYRVPVGDAGRFLRITAVLRPVRCELIVDRWHAGAHDPAEADLLPDDDHTDDDELEATA